MARFWNTYIATRAIRFETVGPDIVVRNEIVRDVTIVIVDDAGVELRAPAHLHYVLVNGSRDHAPAISRLAAHWEVGPVLRQLAGVDRSRLRSIAGTAVRMVRHQRPAEMVGFLRGVNNAAEFRALGCKVWDQNANENAQWLANPFRQGEDDLGSIPGDPPNLIAPPTGCRFHPRCPYASDKCKTEEPPLVEYAPSHSAACWHTDRVIEVRGKYIQTEQH